FLGAYNLEVVTPRGVVHTDDKTSRDARSWHMANGAQSSRVLVPLPGDPYVAVRKIQLVDMDTEYEPEEAPSNVEEFQPLVSRAPITDEDFKASEPSDTKTEDESSDSDAKRKGHRLDDEGHGLDDNGHGFGGRESWFKGGGGGYTLGSPAGSFGCGYNREQPMLITWVDPEDGRVFSPSSPAVLSPIASSVATPTATISVNKDQDLEGYDKDLRELYTRSREVRDVIFSQRYRFRSLEREQERATVTFGALWRLVLALEAWAGHVDA
nr:hypothetical protein [Tanacetum cinerariifolium]